MITRRQFVWGSATLLAGCGTNDSGRLAATSSRESTPFQLGIASGDAAHDSVILWTRLIPSFDRMAPTDPVAVRWFVARDAGMREVVRSGVAAALAEHAYCVHIDADELVPNSTYYYGFEALGWASPVGRTKTLPEPGAHLERIRIALTSCQEYSLGYFTAYRDLVDMQPDLVLHNGDYIYEAPAGTVRPYPFDGEAVTLDEYRALYARYRQDEDLRRAHALVPWIVIWDDHEVANDWGPDHFMPSPHNKPMSVEDHRLRVEAARKAFLEHMPLRASLTLHDARKPIFYRQDVIGDLVEINRLDVRSYRSRPACNEGLALEFQECPDIYDDRRSLLGPDQEDWLFSNFGTSRCIWNCLAQTTIMSPFDRAPGPEVRYETESWDNYAASRTRIIEHIRNKKTRNVVSLGGNIHAFYAGNVTDKFGPVECRNPALTEIVTSSVSAAGGGDERYDNVHRHRAENPCIAYFENRYRGFTLLEFSREKILATFRVVDQVERPDGSVSTLASVAIMNGRIGITPVR